MTLSYEELSRRIHRIHVKDNTPYIKCYKCGHSRIMHDGYGWYVKHYRSGCSNCKYWQVYLVSSKDNI